MEIIGRRRSLIKAIGINSELQVLSRLGIALYYINRSKMHVCSMVWKIVAKGFRVNAVEEASKRFGLIK